LKKNLLQYENTFCPPHSFPAPSEEKGKRGGIFLIRGAAARGPEGLN
jgi:hypothetical protein